MAAYDVTFCGTRLSLLGAGALWWAEEATLVVSDLHLGKSERIARRSGLSLPPYETRDTLERLKVLIDRLRPQQVICLGDTFDDDIAAQNLTEADTATLTAIMGPRAWIWVEGNHDPAPPALGGRACAEFTLGPLAFRHIATTGTAEAKGEISGHYHPKASLRGQSRPAFLMDANRLILPAFGTYTGGLRSTDPTLRALLAANAIAVLTGPRPLPCPLPQ
ncbi:ligase-associated DNA damage response endonuclease PdeM [Arenibacterium sp. LLYu02]|uniref:ligase-associated DNA damage response endonuclease PdeM n=1 Tax=Arenibacterium sp. LLYu02 TaxID=3404132 RepID=UPI003B211DA3